MNETNGVKQALKEGRQVVGAGVSMPSAEWVEILGYAGFDFVFIDAEHGCFTSETVTNLVRAADAAEVVPIVRIPNDPFKILHALEAGCLGIQVPQVNTKEEARRVVASAKYYPQGWRGMAFATRAARYGFRNIDQHLARSNQQTLTVVQIENMRGVENLSEILTVKGIDVVFVGPADLSQSLGLPGQIDHPRVEQTMQRVILEITEAGLFAGTAVGSGESAKKWASRGVKYLLVGTGGILRACRQLLEEIRALDP